VVEDQGGGAGALKVAKWHRLSILLSWLGVFGKKVTVPENFGIFVLYWHILVHPDTCFEFAMQYSAL